MNAQPEIKRRKRGPNKPKVVADKPKLGMLDPLEAAQDQARQAMEGNRKLALAVDVMRSGLELIVVAEYDRETQLPTTTKDLRMMAVAALNEYSQIVGQSWRTHKLSGPTRAGDRNLNTLD